jgi:hypothetical protein
MKHFFKSKLTLGILLSSLLFNSAPLLAKGNAAIKTRGIRVKFKDRPANPQSALSKGGTTLIELGDGVDSLLEYVDIQFKKNNIANLTKVSPDPGARYSSGAILINFKTSDTTDIIGKTNIVMTFQPAENAAGELIPNCSVIMAKRVGPKLRFITHKGFFEESFGFCSGTADLISIDSKTSTIVAKLDFIVSDAVRYKNNLAKTDERPAQTKDISNLPIKVKFKTNNLI